jgi:transaldolase/glucose-6-phosphate isomerase
MTHTRLHDLNALGQSVWYDNIRRDIIASGELERLIEIGVTGVTSNPTIFEKAVGESSDYDTALAALVADGYAHPADIFEELAVEDIQAAADLLRPVYDATGGADGFVSYEVAPRFAADTAGSIAEARRLFARLDRPNVMVKVPATPEGIPAIEALIADGVNVNITLIFGLEAYRQVIAAYQRGLASRLARGLPLNVASVASFFVSRIDTLVDKRLAERLAAATDDAERVHLQGLMGKAAIGNARLAYEIFRQEFGEERFAQLAEAGARVQRPLWASTSTKNPNYSDTLYVDTLIGPDTVNTMPPQTIAAFNDHGVARVTVMDDLEGVRAYFAALSATGIDMDDVTRQVLAEGVTSFAKSFDTLLSTIADKRDVVAAARAERMGAALGRYAARVSRRVQALAAAGAAGRVWARDPELWKPGAPEHAAVIGNRLGWLEGPATMTGKLAEINAFVAEARAAGFTHALLCGMGGSSLAPEVLRATFGAAPGYLDLAVLDTTHPRAVQAMLARSDPAHTLYVISSKSGTTLEVESFHRYFREAVRAARGEHAGENFVAITDPGTPLEHVARAEGFRHVFVNPPDIGGRYSVLSYFGLVPAALAGVDVARLLRRAARMRALCLAGMPTSDNPGAWLGAVLGELALAKHDKLTFVLSPSVARFGVWAEQLIAESLGKEGRGIVPVEGELPAGDVAAYGKDRLFVYLRLDGDNNRATDALAKRLTEGGQPVVRLLLQDTYDLGEEFFRWEFATAVAGAILGVDPFDEPNVTESKNNTRRILEAAIASGALPPGEGVVAAREADPALAKLLGRTKAGDYVALMAYVAPSSAAEALLRKAAAAIRDARGVPVTVGYGPRFLHSTGQLHKGGANNGVFIQLVDDALAADQPIPGQPYGFGLLIGAQALGDLQALRDHERRTLALRLGADDEAGLRALVQALKPAPARNPKAAKAKKPVVKKKAAVKKAPVKKTPVKKKPAKKTRK